MVNLSPKPHPLSLYTCPVWVARPPTPLPSDRVDADSAGEELCELLIVVVLLHGLVKCLCLGQAVTLSQTSPRQANDSSNHPLD